ncbi:NAD(P)H-dependent oxidoreductase subunit E [Synechococcus sp. GreenBA-s]|nr:NAD(P)H-dependent oxidoreductase subunit E [Synechococcus sp. GreenBA-s]
MESSREASPEPGAPSGRGAFPELEPVLRRHGHRPDGLIEVLNRAQELHGQLTPALLRHVAAALRLPLSRVQGTASFYHLFRFRPPAAHSCVVCTGTACHVKGADALLRALERDLAPGGAAQAAGVEAIELSTVRCVGTCGGAPLVVVDGQVWNHQTPASVLAGLRELRR